MFNKQLPRVVAERVVLHCHCGCGCGCVGCGLLHTFWTFGAFNGNSAQLDNVAYTCKRVARYALPNKKTRTGLLVCRAVVTDTW